jgi:NADPH:quinone reductase-like Zn-dependent oxidoreductase
MITMKAICQDRYGSPDVLELRAVPKPQVDAAGVLVRVRAASVNPLDWHCMRGTPLVARAMGLGLRKPSSGRRGVDVAGIVEAVGAEVTAFRPGDEVFGGCDGALAEFVCGAEKGFAPKPVRISFEQAAAIPIAGFTALQALRDRGRLQAGQRVLINGASGGVGTFAVQIAAAFGADVTGVCSTRNVELVRSLGAGQVVDYTVADFARSGQKYDLIVDTVGNRSLRDMRRALTPKGVLVIVGGGGGRMLGPIAQLLRAAIMARFVSHKLVPMVAKQNKEDLIVLKELVDAGKVTPVVDRTYPLAEAAEAMRYLETGHARGKVVVTV